jgi:hypothetical protein
LGFRSRALANRRPPRTATPLGRCATLIDVQSAFGTVLWVVCGVGVVGALLALLAGRKTWDEYGKDHLLLDTDASAAPPRGASGVLERDTEIRQLLEARNARRRRRGEPEIDVEQELARLTAPQIDPELRDEIRQLVIARNHRRARQGKPPLDVEAEIFREIEALNSM